MDKVKRDRSANFSLQERDILVPLIMKYKHILENKKSDSTTWKKKDLAWQNIEKEFNAQSGGVLRSSKTLKIKYEGLKRSVRKKAAAVRTELYRTGGGSNTAIPLDNVEEQIKRMITLSTDGLESIYDSDVLPQRQESQDGINNKLTEDFFVIPPNTMDIDSSCTENGNTDKNIYEDVKQLDISEALHQPSTVGVTTEIKVNENAMDNTRHDYACTCTLSPNKKWDATSRRNLKSRKHSALTVNYDKKPIDELTQARLELINLQKSLLEAEIVEKKKEWDFMQKEPQFKEKEQKWKEEEYTIKLELLRKQLND